MNLFKTLLPISIPFRPTAPIRVTEPRAMTLAVDTRTCHRVHLAAGQRVECADGAVWITRAGDVKDVVICAGEAWVADSQGTALVTGLETAVVTLGH